MSIVINNIGLLVTNDPSIGTDELGQIRNAAIVILTLNHISAPTSHQQSSDAVVS